MPSDQAYSFADELLIYGVSAAAITKDRLPEIGRPDMKGFAIEVGTRIHEMAREVEYEEILVALIHHSSNLIERSIESDHDLTLLLRALSRSSLKNAESDTPVTRLHEKKLMDEIENYMSDRREEDE